MTQKRISHLQFPANLAHDELQTLNGRILHTSLLFVMAFLAVLIPIQAGLLNPDWKVILCNNALFILAACLDTGLTADEIIAKADQALYFPETNGRNQLTVCSQVR